MIIVSSNLFLRQVISLVKMKRFCTLRENSSDHIVASHDHPLIKGEKKEDQLYGLLAIHGKHFRATSFPGAPFLGPKANREVLGT